MVMLDAEGGVDWHAVRKAGESHISEIGMRLVLGSEPLDESSWGLSPEAVESQRRLLDGGRGGG